MNAELNKPSDMTAPTMLQLGQRVIVVIALLTTTVVGIWLWLAWLQVRASELSNMRSTVKLVAAHADHYISSIGHKMEKLASELQGTDPLARPETVLPKLKGLVVSLPDVTSAALVHPDGQMVLSTVPVPAGVRLPNFLDDTRWKSDFERDLRGRGLHISRPQVAVLNDAWMLHLRYTVRDRDDKVRYLIQAGIPLDRQQHLWRSLDLAQDSALGLLRDDGYVISRIPDNGKRENIYGKQVLMGALYLKTREGEPEGEYEGTVVDGSYRLGVYRRLTTQPMYAFLSKSRGTFINAWWSEVRGPLAMVGLFLFGGVLAYVFMSRRYGDRMREIEERMAFSDPSSVLPSSGVQEIDMLMAALAQSRDKLRETAHNREKLLLRAAEAGTYVVRERDGVLLSADASFLAMLGRPESEIIGQSWNEFAVQESGPDPDNSGAELAQRIIRVQPPHADGRWLSVAEYRETLLDGETVRHGLAIDVTDREDLLNQIHLQSERLQSLWQVATTRGKSDVEKRRLMLQLAQETLHMETVAISEWTGEKLIVRDSADALGLFPAGQEITRADMLCRRAIENETTLIVSDLRLDPELKSHPVVLQADLRGFVSIPIFAGSSLYGTLAFLRRQPLTEKFSADDRAFMELLATWFGQMLLEGRQRAELERLAMTDTLTRLTNRRAAETRFQEEFARARRSNQQFSVAVCDLDRFKLINDHYGHDVGDQALLHVSAILRESLREGDWVARWGGEEFIIFLHQADSASAFAAMERLRLAIKGNPVTTPHGPLAITASIGLGTYRGQGDFAAVLSEADGCLYEAKRAGRDRVIMSESSRRGTLWKAGMLQHALLENRIVPAYQVIVDLRTREVVADESLARIVEPDGRIVTATEFIDAAEGINLIHVVDEVVVRQSMQRCAIDICNGRANSSFVHFVNLSAQFLSRREQVQALLQQAAAHCEESGMAESHVKPLVLEITERQLIGNFDDLMLDLRPLVDFGFRLALDDFGSGYSSFLYLAKLPISFLKIEGWMVQNMRTSPRVLAMVQSIIRLARDQGIITIAEHVEDAATADLLAELGADWGQGWYFGRPHVEAAAVQALVTARTGTVS